MRTATTNTTALYPGSSDSLRRFGIGVDSNGAAWVSGYFKGTVDFGGEALSRTGDDYGAFLLGLSASGEHVFSKRVWGHRLSLRLPDSSVAEDGSLVMTGTAVGEIDFGGGSIGVAYSRRFTGALFCGAFRAGAAYDWARGRERLGDYDGYGVAADSFGNYYLVGEVSQASSVDPAPVLVTFDAGERSRPADLRRGRSLDGVVVDARATSTPPAGSTRPPTSVSESSRARTTSRS